MINRDDLLKKIQVERERQFNLPGSEFDIKNTPNDWISIIGHYTNRDVFRSGRKPLKDEFEDSLIKAAAVILAALEHSENMKTKGHFVNDDE